VPYLLNEGLFEIPHGSGHKFESKKPICKNPNTRKEALTLLAILSRDCLENLGLVLNYLGEFDREASWRTNKPNDWSMEHFDDEKSSTGYCGIKNLGCVCYMISLFQQFYMVPGFRTDILSVNDPNHDNLE